MDLDSDSDTDPINRPTNVIDEEWEVSDSDQDVTTSPTRLFQKSRHTGKLYVASGPSWGGPTYRTWMTHLMQMITPFRHPNSSLWAGLVSSCPGTYGCVGKWRNLILLLWKCTRQELQKPVQKSVNHR